MAGQVVFVEYIPYDAESRRAASNIVRALRDAEWDVQQPIAPVDGIEDGVSLLLPIPRDTDPSSSIWHGYEVADKLLDFLHSYNWYAVKGWATDGRPLPLGALRVRVGLYPAAVYVTPPGAKEAASVLEEIKRGRDEMMADVARKRKEQLATLSPDVRKVIEQSDKEWDARMKSETSSGPCQVLNPPF
jgi:hypothetical protein